MSPSQSNVCFSPNLEVICLHCKFQSKSIVFSLVALVLCWGGRGGSLTPHFWCFLLHRGGGGDIYIYKLCTFSSFSLILPQERRRKFSVWRFGTRNYALQTSTVLHLFLSGIALHCRSVIEAGLPAMPGWIQGMGLGSSFLLYIKATFSSISFTSNKNDI